MNFRPAFLVFSVLRSHCTSIWGLSRCSTKWVFHFTYTCLACLRIPSFSCFLNLLITFPAKVMSYTWKSHINKIIQHQKAKIWNESLEIFCLFNPTLNVFWKKISNFMQKFQKLVGKGLLNGVLIKDKGEGFLNAGSGNVLHQCGQSY